MATKVKDKAIEVYTKHYNSIDKMGSSINKIQHRIAIKSAIVTVVEIIDTLPDIHYTETENHRPSFWEEVKKELEKW